MGIIVDALDPKEPRAEKIWMACRLLATTDPEKFRRITKDGRTIELGDEGVMLVRLIAGFYGRMAREEITSIPEDMRHMISHQIRKVQETFDAIQTLRQDTPAVAIGTLRTVYSETRMILAPFVRAESMDAEAARRDIARLMEEFGSKDAKMGGLVEEAQSTLSVLQDQAKKVGAATHAKHFEDAAEGYKKAKDKWFKGFWWTVGGAIAGAGLGSRYRSGATLLRGYGRGNGWSAIRVRDSGLPRRVDRPWLSCSGTQPNRQRASE